VIPNTGRQTLSGRNGDDEIAQVKPGRMIMGKLSKGVDLLEELTAICRSEQVRCGRIEALGAVVGARLGFYDQRGANTGSWFWTSPWR
jgi:predicted DNA-binding protein with PD1-like motif